MTTLDLIALGIISISVLISMLRGLVSEVLSLVSWVAAFWIAKELSSFVATFLPFDLQMQSVRLVIGFVLTFFGVWLATVLLRMLLTGLLDASGLGGVNRMLGSLFGLARGTLIVTVLTLIAGFTDMPKSAQWRESMLSVPFERIVLMVKPWLPQALADNLHYDDSDSGAQIIERNIPSSPREASY